jgi:hypothetical protein
VGHPLQHSPDQTRVVLAVAVHDRQSLAARRVPAGDRGRGQTAGAVPADQPDGGVTASPAEDDLRRGVVKGVVDDDDLVANAGQVGDYVVQDPADRFVFVEGAYDH